jgi:flagellar basal body-associated protein FliL
VKSKLKIIIPLVLVILAGTYKFALAKPAPEPKHKVEGEVYVMPKEFLVNLADGHFAKLGVALVFEHGFSSAPPAAGGHGAAPKPPEGFGQLQQEPLVRDIVTDVLTDAEARELTSKRGRHHLKERIAKRIVRSTDVEVEEVLFTDVAVQ